MSGKGIPLNPQSLLNPALPPGTLAVGQIAQWDGSAWSPIDLHQFVADVVTGMSGTGTGSVTSVGLTMPKEFVAPVMGSPVTSSGTLATAWTTELAGTVFAGPASGPAATPGFRAFTPYDLPLSAYADGSKPAGNTVANTVTETAIASLYTIPAGTMRVGNVIRIRLWGLYSTALIAPTINCKVKIGNKVVATTGTITAIASITNGGWMAMVDCVVVTIGATGTLECQGYAEFATAATTGMSVNMMNTAEVVEDFTGSLDVTATVQWGTASASNTITARLVMVEIL